MGSIKMQKEQYEMVKYSLENMPLSINKFKLMLLWSLFFQQLLLRIFISRSRGGYNDAAISAIMMFREISIFKFVPLVVFTFFQNKAIKFILFLQNLFLKMIINILI